MPTKMYHTKLQEKIFQVRLKRSLKKCTDRELQLTMLCVQKEMKRRLEK